MDELVTDLTLALERTDDPQSSNSDMTIRTKDSPSSTPVRKPIKKRRGRKRRSDFLLSKDLSMLSEESNDSVEEALKDYIENITMCQSDSDNDGVMDHSKRLSMFYRLSSKTDPYPLSERQDGDQLNESIIGVSKKRSKRNKKMKRTTQQSSLGTFQNSQEFFLNGKTTKGTHRRCLKRKLSNRICGSACGETWTRRSKYEEGGSHDNENGGKNNEFMSAIVMPVRQPRHVNFHTLSGEDRAASLWEHNGTQDDIMAGSDSDTSSGNESEGFFTNDEGRLGDDEGEESTFEQEPYVKVIPWWENDDQRMDDDDDDDAFQNVLEGVMNEYGIQPEMSNEERGFQARMNSLKSICEKNNMKFLVEAKRKINKFLHDSSKVELSISPNNKNEREQIHKLASLYTLHSRTESSAHGRVILLKTRNTCKPEKDATNNLLGKVGKVSGRFATSLFATILKSFRYHVEVLSLPKQFAAEHKRRKGLQMSEIKRARRMATEGSVGQFASAIPESNIGNQMIRKMGWVPGTGLGPDKNGIINPIDATLRPRKLGLGHAWPT